MHFGEFIYNLFEFFFSYKNYKCLEELIKITYDHYKFILTYFNKFHGKAYQNKLKNAYMKPKN